MTARKTFQWTVVLVAMLAAGGWYAVRFAFDHKDQLVLEGIRKEVARTMPDWGVAIGDARIDLQGRVWLKDVSITPDPQQPSLVTIPRCLVTIDSDLLFEQKQLLVRTVRIIQPQVRMTRNVAGVWNWQKLSRPQASGQTPEVTFEQGDLLVRLEAGDGVPQAEIGSRQVNVRLVPAGRQRYLVEGKSEIDGAGALSFGGELDLNTGAWRLQGRAEQIAMSQGLLEKAAALAPDVGRKVAELSGGAVAPSEAILVPGAMRPGSDADDGPPVQTASIERPIASGELRLPNLGLSASIGVDFDLSSDGSEAITDYRVLAKVLDGTVSEPLSPVPLSELQGELLIEEGRFVVHQFSARGGASHLSVSGEMRQVEGRMLRDFELSASNLIIDNELRQLLPAGAKRLFDRIGPAGLFTIRGRFRGDGVGTPEVRLDEFTALNCSIRHELFPYPITGVTGTVKQQDEELVLDLRGLASGRPITISGSVKNPGPEAEATVGVQVNDLPLDEQFMAALADPRHRPARVAIEALNLTGRGDLRVLFHRRAGPQQPTLMGVDADLREGTLSYEKFPYALAGVSGHLKFDPWQEKVWRFTNLSGTHGATQVSASGRYDLRPPGGGRLELEINARDVAFDRDLHRATTTAQPSLHQAWVQLNPSAGVAQVEGVRVSWSPPDPAAKVELPSIHVDRGSLTLAAFPFRWENVAADLSWKDGRVSIQQASGRHNETQLRIEGRAAQAAAHFDLLPEGADARWHLRLENMQVRNLDPGPEFRRALPGDVAAVFDQLDPRGPIDTDLALEMKGFRNPQGGPELVTSHWKLAADLQRDRLSVGVDLADVSGRVTADVRWDGQRVAVDGWLDFATARALDMTFADVRGPFTVDGDHVVVGSASMLQTPRAGSPEPQVPLGEQLLASLYGGSVELNADARLNRADAEQTMYRARIRFKDGDLRQWAAQWQLGSSGINGVAHGGLNLYGHGTSQLALRGDNCWMTVTDARLGELPIIARMLTQVVAPQQRDGTAFRYAYLEFDIRDGMFEFGRARGRDPSDTRRIHLVGDSLKMVGQGYVPFAPQLDPRMNLDFYSKAAPSMVSAIPILGPLAKSMSDNWIHVNVTGVLSNPQIRSQAEVPLDNALRQFFGALETGLMPGGPLAR